MANDEQILSVSELNRQVKQLFSNQLADIWLRGEIGGVTIKSGMGHVYFSIKDAKAQIKAIYYHGGEQFQSLGLSQGSKVDAYGRVDLFERDGTYQFNVRMLRPLGLGELQQRFEELKQRLANEGLFDIARKRTLPPLPRCIGVITSMEGAAIRDFRQILDRRHPNIHLRLINAPVQGAGAGAWIAKAVEYLSWSKACDVIVITRGGGSIEDLWEFNDESLARSIAASCIPVISAVGHERDYTICDYVADFRAPTPSAAAELVVKAKVEMQENLLNASRRLQGAMQLKQQQLKMRWQSAAACIFFQRPETLTQSLAQRLDNAALRLSQNLTMLAEHTRQRQQLLSGRLPRGLTYCLQQHKNILAQLSGKLMALDPKSVLGRGYSILLREDGLAVRAATEVAPGNHLRAILWQGELSLEVKDKVPENENSNE